MLQVKELQEAQRTIRGIATTPTPDRVGDVVEPLGIRVAPEIPLLLYHDPHQPVGRARFGTATADGVPFTAQLPEVTEPATLRDRIDEAWSSVRHRLITGVSIGFRALPGKTEPISGGGLRFLEVEVVELSLVVIPANTEATITAVKALVQAGRSDVAASPSRGTGRLQKFFESTSPVTQGALAQICQAMINRFHDRDSRMESLEARLAELERRRGDTR